MSLLENRDPESTFRRGQLACLRWLGAKIPIPLSTDAEAGKTFELDLPGQSVRGVNVHQGRSWTVRLVQPDAPFGGRPAVAGRTWTSELALYLADKDVKFAIRVVCSSLPYATDAVRLTRPRIIVDLGADVGFKDVISCRALPWYLRDNADVDLLLEAITDRNRSLPVYVLTQPNETELGLKLRPFLLDPEELARMLFGLGHVVCLPSALSFRWTALVGKAWSVFRGAVRTYRPGLDMAVDAPTSHPLAMPSRILSSYDGDLRAEDAFTKFLADQALYEAANRRIDTAPCLMYLEATRVQAAEARREAKDGDEMEALYLAEIDSLRAELAEARDEAEEYSDLAVTSGRDLDRIRDENRRLKFQLDQLRSALEARTGKPADHEVEVPDSLEDLPAWVEQELAGRLVLHPRATNAIKDATYENPGLVYRALLALAREYRSMRLGERHGLTNWNEKLQELELRCGPSISEHLAGEHGETYFVRYPLHTSQRRFLELHLRKGTTRDDRYCLAIYYFWDDEEQEVVVGWLPGHLDNRLT